MKGKFYSLMLLVSVAAITICFLIFRNRQTIRYQQKCKIEEGLSFEGVVKNYRTNIANETASFNLGDSPTLLTIPRSSKEVYLDQNDTVQKIKNSHTYIVKRYLHQNEKADTFQFSCKTEN